METPELPNEIIFSLVLTRLPVKSLVRFRCVCKSWSYQLTHDSSFARLHQKTYSSTHILISSLIQNQSQQHFFTAQILQNATLGPVTHILSLSINQLYAAQSLNGLLCIHHPNILYPHQGGGPVYIFNPSTRELITLPRDDPLIISGCAVHVTYNLGFNPVTNEYIVLSVREIRRYANFSARLMCKVFTLGTDSWREIDPVVSFDPDKFSFLTNGVCVNGVMHWMRRSEKFIAAFNLVEEEFREIPIPDGYCNHDLCLVYLDFGHLIQVGGRLALIGDKHVLAQNVMELWILKDYQNQTWVRESINFPFDWKESMCPLPVGIIHTGELLLKPNPLVGTSVWVLLYDMTRRTFRRAETDELPDGMFSSGTGNRFLTKYEESLTALSVND